MTPAAAPWPRSFEVTDGVRVGPGSPPLFLAGPCVIEHEDFMLRMAESLQSIFAKAGAGFVFKSSFDKANRTSITGFRGPGLEDGLRILAKVKAELGVPIVTDIHETWQAEPVAEVADILQIPAFLCRQTDLLVAAVRTGRTVNVKKAQFVAPHEMEHVVGKIESAGGQRLMLTERGSSFGYNALVVDFRSPPQLRAMGWPVLFDSTHGVQLPGGGGGQSGGQRQFVPYLARAAAAVGVDGFFMEVHEDPDQAPSDGPSMLRLDMVGPLVDDLLALQAAVDPLPPVT